MNQRIQELAEQAGMVKVLEEHASEYGDGTFENTPYPELAKFAELIVRECAEWVNDNVGLIDEKAKSDLLKHFGVEE